MANLIDNRQIRVFISSTFQDMQDERDYLMKHTFPILRKLASERDVTLTELDLRWGITEEEAKSGKVVEICLREIENSIPFFIGIIGNRYGWVPEKEDIGDNVTDRFKDVNNYLKHHLSVTEMEMQFGVLSRDEDMHAYFYIKEQKEDADNPEMLEQLKKKVQASRYPSSSYSSPEDLGIQVQQAFTELLNQLFPEGHLSEMEKERIRQRSFMNQLCQNYIRDDKNFQVLDEWMQDWDRHQMVVTGASGLGKSALIANWTKQKILSDIKGYYIIYFFVGQGKTCESTFIRKYLINEILLLYGWEKSLLQQDTNNLLEHLLYRITTEDVQPILFVVDAVNNISDIDHPELLQWLKISGTKTKVLFSSIDNVDTNVIINIQQYDVLKLKALKIHQRKKLISKHLSYYGKRLSKEQINIIAKKPICKNTRVLVTLLNELINFGVYEKINQKIEFYTQPDTIDGFYQNLLKCYEDEFGKQFVKHILSLLYFSNNGLKEEELLAITGCKRIVWSQFYCSFISNLITSNGLIILSHPNISDAINYRYFRNHIKWQNKCGKEIATILRNTDIHRSWEELPYVYYVIRDHKHLFSYLLSIDVLYRFISSGLVYNISMYWKDLINADYEMSAYIDKVESYLLTHENISISKTYGSLLVLLTDLNQFENAILVCDSFEKILMILNPNKTKNEDWCVYYNWRGRINSENNRYNSALTNYKQALSLCTNDMKGLKATILGNIANYYIIMCQYDKALAYTNKEKKIVEIHYGKEDSIMGHLYNRCADIYYHINEYDKAFNSLQRALKIYGDLMDSTGLGTTWHNIAFLYSECGEYEEAIKFYMLALSFQEIIHDYENIHTARTLGCIGDAYNELGKYSEAMDYCNSALKLFKKISNEDSLDQAYTLSRMASININKNNSLKALDCYMKEIEIKKKILGPNNLDIATSYYNMGMLYSNINDLTHAAEFLMLAANCDLNSAYNELAWTLHLLDRYEEALTWAEKAVAANPTTPYIIDTLATIYQGLSRYDEALEQFELCLKLKKEQGASEESIRETEEKIEELKKMLS